MKALRFAISNLQTGIGTTRGYWQYLTTGWKYMLPHGSGRLKAAGRFIRDRKIDIVALCEAEGGSRRTRGVDQVSLVAEEGGHAHHVFFPTLVIGSRVNQGNAVCAHFPVQVVENHPLPGLGEPRFLSEAALQIDGAEIRLFVAHLSLEHKIRRPQIHHLAEIVSRAEAPAVLAGDFNVSEEAELDLMLETGLTKVAAAATFPSWRPRKRLDYLFFSRHFSIQQGEVFADVLFSDHLPFMAEVLFKPPGQE